MKGVAKVGGKREALIDNSTKMAGEMTGIVLTWMVVIFGAIAIIREIRAIQSGRRNVTASAMMIAIMLIVIILTIWNQYSNK